MTPSTPSGRRLALARFMDLSVVEIIPDIEREAVEAYRLELAEKVRAMSEPRCQFIKGNAELAKGHGQWGGGYPWPLTPDIAEGYQLLCGGRRSDHPRTFVGPEWNHDEFVYDPQYDTSEVRMNAVLRLIEGEKP